MYLLSVPRDEANSQFYILEKYYNYKEPLLYIRKFFPLSAWVVNHLDEFGFKDTIENFNCVPCKLTLAQINKMHSDIHNLDYIDDLKEYLTEFDEGIENCRKAIEEGNDVYYYVWY